MEGLKNAYQSIQYMLLARRANTVNRIAELQTWLVWAETDIGLKQTSEDKRNNTRVYIDGLFHTITALDEVIPVVESKIRENSK